jgi:DNA polymerase I-like protein with 3'-5' exonuclease and polymerase domains
MKRSIPEVITLDFETWAIKPRPEYPPRPVGCAVRVPGEKPYYLAWGHPTGNNITEKQATAKLRRLWDSGTSLLFHNAKFDIDVAETHLGMSELPWDQVQDSLLLIFLQDPNRSTLSLKPVAEKVLKLPPNERDEVRAWLVEKGIVRSNDRKWGAFIAAAPGDIVGRYAIGDVDRTFKLFEKYYREVVIKRGMSDAYNRERELMPELLRSERAGVAVDRVRLNRDVARYTTALDATDGWIRKRLKAPGLAVDADADLVAAIVKCGVGDETKWARTAKTGALSTAKDALHEALTDRPLAGALTYRGVLATCTRTFMHPWAETAARSQPQGSIYTARAPAGYRVRRTFRTSRTSSRRSRSSSAGSTLCAISATCATCSPSTRCRSAAITSSPRRAR